MASAKSGTDTTTAAYASSATRARGPSSQRRTSKVAIATRANGSTASAEWTQIGREVSRKGRYVPRNSAATRASSVRRARQARRATKTSAGSAAGQTSGFVIATTASGPCGPIVKSANATGCTNQRHASCGSSRSASVKPPWVRISAAMRRWRSTQSSRSRPWKNQGVHVSR